ncbi:hypothetical protein [Endobacterium cereale]|uniref:hypothetical protein n=1 Tax=Endobacterium cereale TaxID=2663029 RepID=UPI002B46EC2B|nr:hypothetical protein [Endobacterium cereale]MEB2843150.1 hypothetical protein [Endobacterium cereale]
MAEPTEPAALAAAQAFLADPKAEFKLEKFMFRHRTDLSKIAAGVQAQAFGGAKIVFSDGAVAIAATEVAMPKLTQTFYIRLRFENMRWTVSDWLNFRDLETNAMVMAAAEKATQAEWDRQRVVMGMAALDMDLENMRQNMRFMYGSDEEMMVALAPVLADLTALCRTVARTEAVRPLVTSVANADVASIAPEVAAIVEVAREQGVIVFAREGDSGLLGMAGMLPDGTRRQLLSRYLLCTPDEKSLSLQGRLIGPDFYAIRDLGDGVYFVRR